MSPDRRDGPESVSAPSIPDGSESVSALSNPRAPSHGPELDGLPARILELGEELRREGVAVGTSEMLDAFEVLGEISWTSQQDFRESLAATLAKSQEDRRVFEDRK